MNKVDNVVCPVCGSIHNDYYIETNALMHKTNNERFVFNKCSSCDTVFLTNPVKETDLELAIYAEIEKIKKEGITETELQKIKNQKLIEFYNQVETINGKSNNIGTYEVFFGDYRKMFDAPANYNKVTVADVQRVAKKYFTKSNRTVAVLKTNVEE